MTSHFKSVIENCSKLCDATIRVMCLCASEEERNKILSLRPFLSLVNCYIDYYQKQSNLTPNNDDVVIPVFYSLSANDEIRRILAEYLTVRLGILNTNTIQQLRVVLSRDYQLLPEWNRDYKKHRRSFKYKNAHTYGYALRLFKKDVLNIVESLTPNLESSTYNLLICNNQEVASGRDTLIGEFFEQEYYKKKTLLVNSTLNANQLRGRLKRLANSGNVVGNAYMIYYNSNRFKSFGSGRIKQLNTDKTLGFSIRNFFVFVLVDKYFTTGKLLSDLGRLKRILNPKTKDNNFFVLSHEEIEAVNPYYKKSCFERYISNNGGDSDSLLRSEINTLLDGAMYPSSKKNILSLCCGQLSREVFCRMLSDELGLDVNFAQLGLFNFIRAQWTDEFIPKISSFLGDNQCDFAFVTEGHLPEGLTQSIIECFPEHNVSFYNSADLRPISGVFPIQEDFIVVMRYMRFNKDFAKYPNSYDPYYLRPGQKLLEIINEPIFQQKRMASNYHYNEVYNTINDSPFRKDVLDWTPTPLTKPLFDDDDGFALEYDSSSSTPSLQRKLILVTDDGKKRTLHESEDVIAEIDGRLELIQISELSDDYDGVRVQLAYDLEEVLRPRIAESQSKDRNFELSIRQSYTDSLGQTALDFNQELWRLLLANSVLINGEDFVYQSVITHAGLSLSQNSFKSWYDLEHEMILPRDLDSVTSVFRHLGFDIPGTYYLIERRKKARRKKSTRNQNAIIDDFLKEAFLVMSGECTYSELEKTASDTLDYLGIEDEIGFVAAINVIKSKLCLKAIKNIEQYGE